MVAHVRFEGVNKVFSGRGKEEGEVHAVKDLTLTIPDGRYVVLVGPSGCGKTTTLRMVAGLDTPTSGDVYIGERRVTRVHARERQVAMVFQDYALYPHMSVKDNLAFGLRNLKYPKAEIERRASSAASMMQIEALLPRKPRELSGGQRQRVALGRALVREPQVFLFDEPLSNLDAKLRVQMRIELSELQRRLGTTVIHVTHDQVEAMTLGQVIVVMHAGVVEQVGSPQELYRVPATLFVAGFIGSPAMNFAEGRLSTRGGNPSFESEDFFIELPPVTADGWDEEREVVLGVRPESIEVLSGETGNLVTGTGVINLPEIRRPIKAMEYLGSEILCYFAVGDQTWIAKAEPSRPFGVGDVLHFVLRGPMHIFGKHTRKLLRTVEV